MPIIIVFDVLVECVCVCVCVCVVWVHVFVVLLLFCGFFAIFGILCVTYVVSVSSVFAVIG